MFNVQFVVLLQHKRKRHERNDSKNHQLFEELQ